MPYLVHLQPWQRTIKRFKHPFFELAAESPSFNDPVFTHLPLLYNIVGRYLYHWPLTQRFLDEMVSVGLLAIVECATKNTPLTENSYSPICNAIETEINQLQGIVPAPLRTNTRRCSQNKPPIFGQIESDLSTQAAEKDTGHVLVDILEIVGILKNATRQRMQELKLILTILDSENWGLSVEDLSIQLGLSRSRVRQCQQKLLTHYYKLAGENDETI